MKEYRLTQAIGSISDDLLLEASQVTPKRRIATRWRRLTAVAAMVILFSVVTFLWPADDISPYFSVYVYANESDSVELSLGGVQSAYSSVASDTICDVFSAYSDESLMPAPYSGFRMNIVLHGDETPAKVEVVVNGEIIEPDKPFSDRIWLGYPLPVQGEKESIDVGGTVEHMSTIKVILYSTENVVLQRKSFVVFPIGEGYSIVIYEDFVSKSD